MNYKYAPMPRLVTAMSVGFIANAVCYIFTGITMISAYVGGVDFTDYLLRWTFVFFLVSPFLFLIQIILFCFWIHRANSNARALGAERMSFTPGWSVGWFFVPIMNIFRPYQVVREIWNSSGPSADSGGNDVSAPIVIKVWWGLWLISTFWFRSHNTTLSNNYLLLVLSCVATVANVGSCILAAVIVRGVSERQKNRARTISLK
jgi:Domain of unknown function (DUF4328)